MCSMEPYADDDAKRKKRIGDFFRNTGIPDWILVSKEGVLISTSLSGDKNLDIISAAIAAIQSVSKRVVEQLARGRLKRILIEGVDGLMILSEIGSNAILGTFPKSDPNLGMVFLNIPGLPNKIAELLDDPDKADDKEVE